MSFSVTPLLLHGDYLPESVRQDMNAAYRAGGAEARSHLEAAARTLHRELALDCADVRELVGLDTATCE